MLIKKEKPNIIRTGGWKAKTFTWYHVSREVVCMEAERRGGGGYIRNQGAATDHSWTIPVSPESIQLADNLRGGLTSIIGYQHNPYPTHPDVNSDLSQRLDWGRSRGPYGNPASLWQRIDGRRIQSQRVYTFVRRCFNVETTSQTLFSRLNNVGLTYCAS